MSEKQFQKICVALKLPMSRVINRTVLSNGPSWQVIELASAADVLAVAPFAQHLPEFRGVALIGAHRDGLADFEVRNLGPASMMSEDPITGSLNAAIARWKYDRGGWIGAKIIAQGTYIGRAGRVYLHRDKAGTVWVGGAVHILIDGTVRL